MAISIALVNQKGGCGKTTSTVNLAGELSQKGYKVLIVDCDSQGNASANTGVINPRITLSDVLLGDATAEQAIIKTSIENISVIPANLKLQSAELAIQRMVTRSDNILAKALQTIDKNYDFVLLDCAPSIGVVTVNALTYTNYVLIPLRIDRNSVEGYTHLTSLINTIRTDSNRKLKILGSFFVAVERNITLDKQLYEDTKQKFGDMFIDAPIRKNAAIREAPLKNVPISYYDKNSNGHKDYLALTDAILYKLKMPLVKAA